MPAVQDASQIDCGAGAHGRAAASRACRGDDRGGGRDRASSSSVGREGGTDAPTVGQLAQRRRGHFGRCLGGRRCRGRGSGAVQGFRRPRRRDDRPDGAARRFRRPSPVPARRPAPQIARSSAPRSSPSAPSPTGSRTWQRRRSTWSAATAGSSSPPRPGTAPRRAAGANFELLIPSARLSPALADLSELAEVRSRSENTLDITAPFVSARERLRDARAETEGLLRQLAEADTDAERASVKAQLQIVRGRIAAFRAQVERLAAAGRLLTGLASDRLR